MNWQPHRYSTQMFDTDDRGPVFSALASPRNPSEPAAVEKQPEDPPCENRAAEQLTVAFTEQLLKVIEEKDAVINQYKTKNLELERKLREQIIKHPPPPPPRRQGKGRNLSLPRQEEDTGSERDQEQLRAQIEGSRRATPGKRKVRENTRHRRNALSNSSRSENPLIKSSPQANEAGGRPLDRGENRQNLPNSTRAADSKKIVFYELPYSPNPKITRAQLEAFKQFHTNPMQRVRNSTSGVAAGLRAGESTKDSNKRTQQMTGTASASTSASRKRGCKKAKINVAEELKKLKGRIMGLVQTASGQNRVLHKLGYV